MMTRYFGVVWCFRKCAECDHNGDGFWQKFDCGCAWEKIVAEGDDLNIVRLQTISKARRKGTTLDGRMTGDWQVHDRNREEEIISFGKIARFRQGKG